MKWTVLIHRVRIVKVVTVDKLLIHLIGQRRGFLLRSAAVNGKMPAWCFTWFVLSNGVIWRWPPWCQCWISTIEAPRRLFFSSPPKTSSQLFGCSRLWKQLSWRIHLKIHFCLLESRVIPSRESHQPVPVFPPNSEPENDLVMTEVSVVVHRQNSLKKIFYQKQVNIQPLCHCVLQYEIALLLHCGNDTNWYLVLQPFIPK